MTSAFSIERSRFSFLAIVLWVAPFLSMACTKHTLATTPGTDASSAFEGGSSTDRGGETAGMTGTGDASGSGGATQTEGGIAPDASFDVPAGPDGVVPCASGQKRCDGLCVAFSDPKYGCDIATCDMSGCPTIPGATLVCQGSLCVVGTCGTGTKKCGDRCADVNDPTYGCGASTCDASTCPNPGAGGTLSCQAGACVIATCSAGTKKCGTRCVAVTDPTYGCGASTCDASTCPSAGTGTLVCQAGACVVGTCGATTKKCGDKCVPTDANNGCGDAARCTACATTEACVGAPVTLCQCVPTIMTTACAGKCGSVPNGCGGNHTCSTCTAPQTCNGGGVANVCGCTPNNTAACVGKACGPATNNCGQAITCVDTCTGINRCNGGTAGPNGCGCTPPVAMTAACANKCGSVANGCGGTYACGTCAAGQKCDPATSMCVANCTGVTCGANLKCDPATGGCVDICTGGGTGTASHCCLDTDCPTAPACKVATCNVASKTCSTTNKGPGAADPACPTSVATCQAGGCNGLGACLPAPNGTMCAGFACSNLAENQGQYTMVDHHQKVCNGALGAAACQNDINRGCAGMLACADTVNCKTACIGDGDCLSGSYCAGGVCMIRKTFGLACVSDHECATRLCFDLGTNSGTPTGNKCIECSSKEHCPQNNPTCDFVFTPGRCTSCDANMQRCNADGTSGCAPISDADTFSMVACTGGAPTCVASHCRCGTGPDCVLGMVCVAGVCKIDGRQACVTNGECASGVCTTGMCNPTADGTLCRSNGPFSGSIMTGGCASTCDWGDISGASFCGP